MNFLHSNPYPNTAAPGQTRECESGNEPYTVGKQVIGNVPGNQGTRTQDQLNERPADRRAENRAARQANRRLPARARSPGATRRSGSASWSSCSWAAYVAYTKHIPFNEHGLRAERHLRNAATLRLDSPVRIAGVNVGKVIRVEPKGDAAEVTFTVDDEGRPVHTTRRSTIRPRLFLEGNFFLDLQPGSPSAPDLASGGTSASPAPATAVQLDEVLTALQSDSRQDLQELLEGYGTGLTYKPTAAEDVTQDSDVQGRPRPQPLNDTFRYGGRAGRDGAIVQEALLGTAAARPLGADRRPRRDVFAKLEGREASCRADLEPQHDHGRAGRRAVEPLGHDRRAGAHARGGRADAAAPERCASRPCAPSPARWCRACVSCRGRSGGASLAATRPSCCCATRSWAGSPGCWARRPPRWRGRRTPRSGSSRRSSSSAAARATCSSPTGNIVVNDAFSSGSRTTASSSTARGPGGRERELRRQRPSPAAGGSGGPTLRQRPNPNGGSLNDKIYASNPADAARRCSPQPDRRQPPPFQMKVPCYQQRCPQRQRPGGRRGRHRT